MPTDGSPQPRGVALKSLSPKTLHLVIDMQRVFAEETEWHTPALTAILPKVTRLVEARPEQTLFARFIPARNAAAAEGRWRHYYEIWASVTGDRLDPAMLDLVAPLAALARPDQLVDKTTHSAFNSSAFADRLLARNIDTLIMTGIETDVCVLGTAFDAVDRGYRVVIPSDAVASSSPSGHDAVLAHVLPRLAQQVDITTVDGVLAAWSV